MRRCATFAVGFLQKSKRQDPADEHRQNRLPHGTHRLRRGRRRLFEPSHGDCAELEVSAAGFSLYVPQLYRLGPLAWPRPVDVDAARAKFLRKSGVLQVTLPGM